MTEEIKWAEQVPDIGQRIEFYSNSQDWWRVGIWTEEGLDVYPDRKIVKLESVIKHSRAWIPYGISAQSKWKTDDRWYMFGKPE
jgi:hypothetical protein